MLTVYNPKEKGYKGYVFYIINKQDYHIIRVRNEEQEKMLYYCWHGPLLEQEEIDWLIKQSGFKYFDNVNEFVAWQEKELDKF
ncbi:MAG TPA: hypothetical protein DDZ91_11985 [Firmicutes bacterium]|jgi:hypothetical protein|nr:hypothetical protein [Bacillota bacterium]